MVAGIFCRSGAKIGIKPEIFLLGGTADQPLCKEIAEKIGSDRTCRDFSGATSIFETARLIDQCDLVITNDTGVQHIAAARRAPVVAIFGSTVQEFGFAPFRTPFRVVERALPCRPCTHIGRAQCPRGDFACMTEVLPHDVLSSAESLLQEVFLSFPS